MGRLEINDGLNLFRDWLIGEGKSESTSLSYTSIVRTMLAQVRDNQFSLNYMRTFWEELGPRDRVRFKAPWVAYAKYYQECVGYTVAVPFGKKAQKDEKRVQKLNPEIISALKVFLDSGFNIKEIGTLTWGDVDRDTLIDTHKDYVYVTSPRKGAGVRRVSKEALTPLYSWSKPRLGEDLKPLLTRLEGGSDGYPLEQLSRQLYEQAPLLLDGLRAQAEKVKKEIREEDKGAAGVYLDKYAISDDPDDVLADLRAVPLMDFDAYVFPEDTEENKDTAVKEEEEAEISETLEKNETQKIINQLIEQTGLEPRVLASILLQQNEVDKE